MGDLSIPSYFLLLCSDLSHPVSQSPPALFSSCTRPHSPRWSPWGPWSVVSLLRWRRDLQPSAAGQSCSFAGCHWCAAPPLRRLAGNPQWLHPLQAGPARNASPRWLLRSYVSWLPSPRCRGDLGKDSSHPKCWSCSCTWKGRRCRAPP